MNQRKGGRRDRGLLTAIQRSILSIPSIPKGRSPLPAMDGPILVTWGNGMPCLHSDTKSKATGFGAALHPVGRVKGPA